MVKKYPNGFVWEGKSNKINYDDLLVGDAVTIYCKCGCWQEGVILKLDNTLFHHHDFLVIQGFGFLYYSDEYVPKRFKFYSHEIKEIKIFAKVVPKK